MKYIDRRAHRFEYLLRMKYEAGFEPDVVRGPGEGYDEELLYC